MTKVSLYPSTKSERDVWVLKRRLARSKADLRRPHGFFVEQERTDCGALADVATLLLTSRECPWRCVMCDLWQDTTTDVIPVGAIPGQIKFALENLPASSQVKLYNSGSFFDLKAVPRADYENIAALVSRHDRVIVESHPALVGSLTAEFRDLLTGKLEVAMGLETVHTRALEKLNKGVTAVEFAAAAERLRRLCVDLRVFLLVQPPFIGVDESLFWLERSIDFAFDCGATAISLIPTRRGNGAMEELERYGDFTPPSLAIVESALEYALGLRKGRAFVDLWEAESFATCITCRTSRLERLSRANLSQHLPSLPGCSYCGGES